MRRAFSLAEIMLAIGILGIGMLMVAATFPVGIDQARVVAEQSYGPIIANEAFALAELYLKEPSTGRRVWDQANIAGGPLASFRDSLAVGPNLTSLLVPAAGATLDINVWLSAPSQPYLGGQTGYYPSVPAVPIGDPRTGFHWKLADGRDPPYTWSMLYRRQAPASVQFTVFVNRRSTATPILVEGPEAIGNEIFFNGTSSPQMDRIDPKTNTVMPSPVLSSAFGEGMYIVRPNGAIGRVTSIELDRGASPPKPRIVTTFNWPTAVSNVRFWFIPADPQTGKSPCIGVYSRTYPMY
jgi:hypothetical protein